MAEVADNLVIATGEANDDLSLLDVLDHVLNKGVVIRGKLVEHATDENGAEKARERQVEFKSFPAEVNR